MSPTTTFLQRTVPAALILFGLAAAGSIAAPPPSAPNRANSYQVQNLVSLAPPTGAIAAPNHDVNLQNGWGVAFNPTGPVWVSDNGTGKSTLYDGNGLPFPPVAAPPIPSPLVVTIPPASGDPADTGSPTGLAFNASNDFVVSNAAKTASGAAKFLWASEDGMISGWAPSVDVGNAQKAVVANAVYKGITIAGDGSTAHFRLYAADFIGQKIDVYDDKFNPIVVPGGFADPTIPRDFGPFNILNIQGNLYVAYAKTQPGSHDEAHGPGLGYVNVFDADGNLLVRLASKGKLNAPWGMALAPQGFGKFSNDILVANFGDGTINAFDPQTGHFDGQLKTPDGKTLAIEGLWGIAFGNGIMNQQTDTLFFAAGPNDEGDGLYGRIDLVPPVKGGKGDDMQGD
ncbi:MAG TPA: TIGR03118 family protein [Casimicrobiaceae bacterium]|nr:TIGR03118 family protein [Casimicrobiaceae bacterium]